MDKLSDDMLQNVANETVQNILDEHQITSDLNANQKKKKATSIKSNLKTTLDKEISLDPSKTIMSKTNARGIIEYANDYFMEVSGYEEYELMGQPHNVLRHPDMPQVVFKLLWERLNKGENIHAFVKNLAKDGRYYWVLTNFETKYDDEGIIISHYSRRKTAPKNTIYTIEKLYKTLRAIELKQGLEVALNYFNGLLEEKHMTYDDFILSILGVDKNTLDAYFMDSSTKSNETKKRSIFGRLFK